MTKNIGALKKRIISLFMIVGIVFETFAPAIVMADVIYEDADEITIGGNPVINGTTFEYEHGDITITKNGTPVNSTTFEVAVDDQIVITLTPDTDYNAKLHNNSKDYDIMLSGNTYSFKIGRNDGTTLSLTPSFTTGEDDEPPVEAIKYDFTINGKLFTNVASGDVVNVPSDFNMDSINEFYVTKIVIEGVRTYTYATGEYSYNMLDANNLRILETHFNKISDNLGNIRIISHANDILAKDIVSGKTKEDYFGFYMTGIKFVKQAFRGVEVSTGVMPDNYDFTIWNGADLSSTTKSNPGIVTAYYGSNTISLESSVSSQISEIKLVDDAIPNSAININSETGKITILSNYYNKIPLQIKLVDGTVGYITIDRIGIFIGDINIGNKQFFHGAAANVGNNLDVDTDKYRIAATFYHEDTTTYNDYDLIVNLIYNDGSTETVIAKGVGDIHNSNGNITGSDYILWEGTSIDEAPKKVSVTAVKKGATSDSDTFKGATFGSGAGVVWEGR